MNSNKGEGVETMAMATTVQKWGNSLAVRIPKDVAERVASHTPGGHGWQVRHRRGHRGCALAGGADAHP